MYLCSTSVVFLLLLCTPLAWGLTLQITMYEQYLQIGWDEWFPFLAWRLSLFYSQIISFTSSLLRLDCYVWSQIIIIFRAFAFGFNYYVFALLCCVCILKLWGDKTYVISRNKVFFYAKRFVICVFFILSEWRYLNLEEIRKSPQH